MRIITANHAQSNNGGGAHIFVVILGEFGQLGDGVTAADGSGCLSCFGAHICGWIGHFRQNGGQPPGVGGIAHGEDGAELHGRIIVFVCFFDEGRNAGVVGRAKGFQGGASDGHGRFLILIRC